MRVAPFRRATSCRKRDLRREPPAGDTDPSAASDALRAAPPFVEGEETGMFKFLRNLAILRAVWGLIRKGRRR
jgi:hypothetical protein